MYRSFSTGCLHKTGTHSPPFGAPPLGVGREREAGAHRREGLLLKPSGAPGERSGREREAVAGMGRYRGLYVALLLLALPLQAPGASRNAVADAGMGSEARRTPVFVTFWDIMPDGRTLASRTQDTPDTPTPTPNISQWVEAIIHAPSDAGPTPMNPEASDALGRFGTPRRLLIPCGADLVPFASDDTVGGLGFDREVYI